MSARPRLGGDGRLRWLNWVSVSRTGEIRGTFAASGKDPFERTDEDVLLAEAFARFDFTRPRKAQQWFLRHGVVDLAWMFPEVYRPSRWAASVDGFGELVSDVLDQQRSVRWHVQSLARLSTERHRVGKRRLDRGPHEGWDPKWADVAIRAPDGNVVWFGAQSRDEGQITVEMQRYARYRDVPNRKRLSDDELMGRSPDEFTEEWWPAAHAAWKRIQSEQIPVLWFPDRQLFEDWPFDMPTIDAGYDVSSLRGVGTDWHGLFEVERRLLRPYVRRAAEHHLEILATPPPAPPGERELRGELWYGRLVATQKRWWRSLLAPGYLQLYEALVRISEGRPGAAFCRECGQPFLILDARRSAFCNDKERARWFQRERRRRLAGPPAIREAVS